MPGRHRTYCGAIRDPEHDCAGTEQEKCHAFPVSTGRQRMPPPTGQIAPSLPRLGDDDGRVTNGDPPAARRTGRIRGHGERHPVVAPARGPRERDPGHVGLHRPQHASWVGPPQAFGPAPWITSNDPRPPAAPMVIAEVDGEKQPACVTRRFCRCKHRSRRSRSTASSTANWPSTCRHSGRHRDRTRSAG